MAIVFLDSTAKVLLILLLPMLVSALSLTKEIPKSQEQRNKENSTKDLIAATSYIYSKNNHGRDTFDRPSPARFRNINGLNTGLKFPRFNRRFHFPIKYRAGNFGGVDGGIDDISSGIETERLGMSDGIGKKTFGSRILHVNSDDIDDSTSYVGLKRYRPSAFDLDARDESDDLPGFDDYHDHYHDHEYDKEHHRKDKEYIEDQGSSGEEESSKSYKAAEEFEKEEKSKKEEAEKSGLVREQAAIKKAHEDSEKKYKEKDESVNAAKGEHIVHNEGQKKGHKTTGYHNVYHKDEYKKDTTFYDDEHADEKQEHYSHEDEKHARGSGEYKKGEKLDTAYEQAERDRKGFFTNGHQYGVAQGHDREEDLKEYQEKEHEALSEARHKSSSELAEASHSHH